MISDKIFGMKSTIKLQLAATAKVKNAFLWNYTSVEQHCTVAPYISDNYIHRLIRGAKPLKLTTFCI
jgi:hypothetical protein